MFEEPEDVSSRSFFSEIIASISDVRFSRNGRYILSRDYLTVKLWDVTMESRPVEVYPVHDYLRSRLCSLYENDCIFDKFECGFNGDDRYVFCLKWTKNWLLNCSCKQILTELTHKIIEVCSFILLSVLIDVVTTYSVLTCVSDVCC